MEFWVLHRPSRDTLGHTPELQVFCQSAIDGAQNDHASKVHAVLSNKEARFPNSETESLSPGLGSYKG